jgi:hypothetical protein
MEKEFKKSKSMRLKGGPNYVQYSIAGYRNDSPDRFNPHNVVPSNHISMKNVAFPVVGIDDLGNQIYMTPENEYVFPGSQVFEIPAKRLLKNVAKEKMKKMSGGGKAPQNMDFDNYIKFKKDKFTNKIAQNTFKALAFEEANNLANEIDYFQSGGDTEYDANYSNAGRYFDAWQEGENRKKQDFINFFDATQNLVDSYNQPAYYPQQSTENKEDELPSYSEPYMQNFLEAHNQTMKKGGRYLPKHQTTGVVPNYLAPYQATFEEYHKNPSVVQQNQNIEERRGNYKGSENTNTEVQKTENANSNSGKFILTYPDGRQVVLGTPSNQGVGTQGGYNYFPINRNQPYWNLKIKGRPPKTPIDAVSIVPINFNTAKNKFVGRFDYYDKDNTYNGQPIVEIGKNNYVNPETVYPKSKRDRFDRRAEKLYKQMEQDRQDGTVWEKNVDFGKHPRSYFQVGGGAEVIGTQGGFDWGVTNPYPWNADGPTVSQDLNFQPITITDEMWVDPTIPNKKQADKKIGEQKFKLSQKRPMSSEWADWGLAGMSLATSILEGKDRRKNKEQMEARMIGDAVFAPHGAGDASRGTWSVNHGNFRPNQHVPVQFQGFNQGFIGSPMVQYQDGGEYYLSDKEIDYIKRMGGTIEYLD